MKETMLSQSGRSLLEYAQSRLSPEVFSHPIWVRFGKKETPDSLNIVDHLSSAAKNIQSSDPGIACQLLLICAVYQNRAGQAQNAVLTVQQALTLAERTNLSREVTWAIWGACAIYAQQGNFEQAATRFIDLQAVLSEQNEWILANYVDVLRQSLFQSGSPHNNVFENLITPTLEWLQNWGFTTLPEGVFETLPEHVANPVARQEPLGQPSFPGKPWPVRWHTLMLAIRGELRLQWIRDGSSPAKSKSSWWGAILSFLHIYILRRDSDTQVHDDFHPLQNIALPPPVKDDPPRFPSKTRKKARETTPASQKSRRSKRDTSIPVTVHMLGAFRMTIGDVPVKIPSSRSLSLFKYLLIHHKQAIPREVLMDKFWPDAEPETARNSLNVAIHSLRQHLHTVSDLPLIVFEAGSYGLTPNLQVWIDVEEFERAHQTGHRLETRNQMAAAIAEYECAVSLYQGDFLEENPYEEWTILDREHHRIAYLDTLDRLSQIYFEEERYSACRTACQLILIKDPCREDAHCLLMRCYSRQRQPHLALYQYQVCVEALRGELQVEPAPETTQLYNRIRRREQV